MDKTSKCSSVILPMTADERESRGWAFSAKDRSHGIFGALGLSDHGFF